MKKINNWKNVQESTNFKRLEPNAYVCKILNVEDNEEKEYLRLSFDIIEGDEKGYFMKQFKEDTRKDKKWSNAGTFVRSYKEKALPMFKGFLTAIDKTNNSDFNEQMEENGEFDVKKLKDKKIVLIIADEEYLNQQGKKRTRNYVASVRSMEAYKNGDFTIPALKELDQSKVVATSNSTPADFKDPFADDGDEKPNNESVNDSPFDDDDENPFA